MILGHVAESASTQLFSLTSTIMHFSAPFLTPEVFFKVHLSKVGDFSRYSYSTDVAACLQLVDLNFYRQIYS